MRSFVFILLMIFLAGCYTQQALESREPYTILEVATDPETLAECFPRHLGILSASGVTRTDEDPDIILTALDSVNAIFFWQLRLSPIADGNSKVVIRTAYYIGGPHFQEKYFDAMAACGEIISREDAG
ncbi:MAG: hypothetical protein IH987_15040 [Planctomycetes bacterium]|nr:hypothetical protein [Planctomycetota bacterium]